MRAIDIVNTAKSMRNEIFRVQEDWDSALRENRFSELEMLGNKVNDLTLKYARFLEQEVEVKTK